MSNAGFHRVLLWLTFVFPSLIIPVSAWVAIDSTPSRRARTCTAVLCLTSTRREWISTVAASVVAASALTAKEDTSWAATIASPTTRAKALLCDPCVSVWHKNARTVILLGTDHLSPASAALAGDLVAETLTDAVFVELNVRNVVRGMYNINKDGTVPGYDGRLLAVLPPASYDSVQPQDNTKTKPTHTQTSKTETTASVEKDIKGMYDKMEQAGFQSSQEFSIAIQQAKKIGSKIVFGDRDVKMTLSRVTEALSETDPNFFSEWQERMAQLQPDDASMLSPTREDLKDDAFRQDFSRYVETSKAKESIELQMREFKELAPQLYTAIVAERDLYMANGIDNLDQLGSMVAVMGLAHVSGVEQILTSRGWKSVPQECPNQ